MRPDPWLTVLGGFILAGLLLPLKADGKPDPPQPNQPDRERGGTRPPDQGHPRQKDPHSRNEGGHPSTQSGEDGCSEVRVRRNTKYEVVQGEELRIGCPVVFCSQTPPTVVWYKVEEAQIQINSSISRGIKIVWVPLNESVGTSFLVFERIHKNNSGLYRCGMKGTVGHSIRVQVYGQNETKTITTQPTNHTNAALNKNADEFWIYLYFVPGIVLFVVMVIIISIVSMRGCRVRPKETQLENQYASVPMVEHSGHLQLSPRGSPVVLPGRRSTKRRPGESTPSGNNHPLHPPMSQDRNRQRGVATEDNASGVLYVTLNLQQRPGGRTVRTEEPPSEYAAIRVK